jgi:orotate phosphoribosyltransferase
MVAIFTYGFAKASNAFEQAQCQLITLSDYDHLLDKAVQSSYISADQLSALKAWKEEIGRS